MVLFSERYGYTKPSDVIIRERITPEIQNAICNCYDDLKKTISRQEENIYGYQLRSLYPEIEKEIWVHFLNKRKIEYSENKNIIINHIKNDSYEWYNKLNLIEYSIKTLYYLLISKNISIRTFENFIDSLNYEFKRLNFSYRIINGLIIEITSEFEISTIEEALYKNSDNIRIHLNKALELYAQKPIGDYRNSIKESISAVEAASRNITGENVLNFKKMEEKGILISSVLRQAFEKLYGYTNDKSTGIRHALMDDTNAPEAEEALFMLVSCSAFINYLNKKIEENKPA
ncbi:AbiJ-NTD4 domain-containing protein [Parabacteroides johnsonii]|uniref:AbiJ-NTD4 domain-containing protein n=1 Tax=Parabacteroides johnsonii TaxID=387661 RepID=UPI00242DCBDD|nr:hypothetical protein [Parabacteroides johnsonii]